MNPIAVIPFRPTAPSAVGAKISIAAFIFQLRKLAPDFIAGETVFFRFPAISVFKHSAVSAVSKLFPDFSFSIFKQGLSFSQFFFFLRFSRGKLSLMAAMFLSFLGGSPGFGQTSLSGQYLRDETRHRDAAYQPYAEAVQKRLGAIRDVGKICNGTWKTRKKEGIEEFDHFFFFHLLFCGFLVGAGEAFGICLQEKTRRLEEHIKALEAFNKLMREKRMNEDV